MKKAILFFIGVLIVWLIHGHYLIKVSKKELVVKQIRQEMENLEKEVEKKEIEYDTLIDLEKIGEEMKQKKNMSISKEMKFFQIDE